ncbi:MAG: hypothetical protein ACOC1E_00900 [Marinilabiliaceae bacterium]
MEERTSNQQGSASAMKTWLIVLGILFILALGTMIYYVVRGGNLKEEISGLEEERTTLQEEKQQVISERDEYQENVSQLESENEEMKEDHKKEIESKEDQIAAFRSRVSQMNQLKEQIEEYKEMESDYKDLQEKHEDLVSTRDSLEDANDELAEKLASVRDSVEMSGDLKAYHISPLTKWERWLWADRYNVSRANRVDETTISFELGGNIFTGEGTRTVYLNMVDPSGNVMYPSDDETFEMKESGEEIAFTKKKEIEYKGDDVPVNFTVEHENSLEPGVYEIEVYIDGELKKSSSLELN